MVLSVYKMVRNLHYPPFNIFVTHKVISHNFDLFVRKNTLKFHFSFRFKEVKNNFDFLHFYQIKILASLHILKHAFNRLMI